MPIATFLRDLADRDIRITLKDEKLQLSAAEGVLTEPLRREITSRKPEIIAFLRSTLEEPKNNVVLHRVPRDQPLPLSFAQQRLWFLHKLNPNDPVYNLGVSLSLLGAIDEQAVQHSLDTLAKRHEILRTTFQEVDGVPIQVVTDIVPTLTTVDMTDVPDEQKTANILAFRKSEVEQPFTLTTTPPIRATLVRVTPDVSVVIVTIHHILTDGWSLGVFVQQLRELYEAYRTGASVAPIQEAWQYADYAYSERIWFEASDQQPHMDYWKKQLGGVSPSLDLPVDHSPSRVRSSNGAIHTFTIPAPLAQQLRTLSNQSGVTLFTALLTVFKVLLYRYSGKSDIIVGTPVANRRRIELESLLGLFVSTVVLRTDLSNDLTVRDLMRMVHNNVLDAHEHQDFPFEMLVDLIRPDRNLTQPPLFQTAFVFQNTPLSRTYDTTSGGATFELSLYLWDGGDDIPASFEYNADLFEANTIARMTSHFLTLAEVIVADPGRRLSELPMLTTAERVQVLEIWNDTTTAYPRDETISSIFKAQVDATPDAIALIAPGAGSSEPIRLTYRELDQQANKFANYLQQLDVLPFSNVGIALNRSADFIIAVLATLKCGAAYVPIDNALPADRIVSMLEDSTVSLVIVSSDADPQLPYMDWQVASFEEYRRQQATLKDTHIQGQVTADSIAYVMYTSGSTGKPKGVAVPHRGIVRLVRNTNYVTLTADDVILACAPVSFDASTFEIWGSLLNGGTLVLYPPVIPEPHEIARMVREYHVTTLWLTAGLFHLMAETQPEGFRGLRQLLAGGDVLSPTAVRKALRELDGGVLINGYGPTENTTFTCCHRMTSEDDVGDTVPIGRPISNTRVYILDSVMRPVAIGVRGELWTSGDGLARGYLNDSNLTASRFLPDPFSRDPNAKIYRTGDIVRYRTDGVIEFVGRVDNQVKIRGFRIELSEVEQALREYPGAIDAAVVAKTIGNGQKQLIGYVVTKESSVASIDVKRFLQQQLPDYAIPSTVVSMEAFPLTVNGKINYAKLPEPTLDTSIKSTEPQSAFEAQLLAIWEKVLGITGIGRTDNFFDIGGNSLMALQLLANIEKAIGKRIPATVLFESQTVESLAVALGCTLDETSGQAVPLQRGGSKPPVFIIPGVNGNVIGYEKLAQALGADRPVYGIRSSGLDGEAPPLNRIDAIATQFVEEIRRIQSKGPYRIVGFCMGGIVAYEVAQKLVSAGERVDHLGMIDTWPPMTIPTKLATNQFGQKLIFVGQGVRRHLQTLLKQPQGQRLRYLKQKISIVSEMVAQRDVYRGEHAVLYSDLVMRANQHAAANHVPAPYPGDVDLFLVNDRPMDAYKDDPRLSWQKLVQGTCTLVSVDGTDSGSLLRPPFVQGLADELRARFDVQTS